MKDNPYSSDDTKEPTPHSLHVTQEPCDECAGEMKRLAIIAAGVGMVLGIGMTFLVVRSAK